MPPFGPSTAPLQANFFQNNLGIGFPDGANHFSGFSPCQGINKANGKQCTYKIMLQCAFCPFTRFTELNTGKFSTWKSPLACRDPGDVVRNAKGHVEAARDNWHRFWYAARYLAHVVSLDPGGLGPAGGAADGGLLEGQVDEWKAWLKDRAHVFASNKEVFAKAGLFGTAGAEYNIGPQFAQAEQLLKHFFGADFARKAGRKSIRKRDRDALSQSGTVPTSPLPQDVIFVDDAQSEQLAEHAEFVQGEKRVRTEIAQSVGRLGDAAAVYASHAHAISLPETVRALTLQKKLLICAKEPYESTI